MEWDFKQADPIADISNLKVTINTKSKLSYNNRYFIHEDVFKLIKDNHPDFNDAKFFTILDKDIF